MKNPTTAKLNKAIELRLAGEPWANVLSITGLSHSQAERHEFRFKMLCGLPGFEPIVLDADTLADPVKLGKIVAEKRAEGISWGVIGELAGLPESRIRKAFAAATVLDSKGQRIGKGGRFAFADGSLYEPTPATGFAMKPGSKRPEVTKAGTAKGLTKEQRDMAVTLKGSIADRRAKRLAEIKKSRKAPAAKAITAKASA